MQHCADCPAVTQDSRALCPPATHLIAEAMYRRKKASVDIWRDLTLQWL